MVGVLLLIWMGHSTRGDEDEEGESGEGEAFYKLCAKTTGTRSRVSVKGINARNGINCG